MQRGDWTFNGDSIRLSSDGVLLDGQHRLNAVVESGLPQHFLFIENMESEVGMTIDNGKVRNGGDTLALQANVKPQTAQTISGALKIFYKHEHGGTVTSSGNAHKLTNAMVVEQYNEHKHLIDKCLKWMDLNVRKKGSILSRAEMLGLLLIFGSIDFDECIVFCEMVFCGLHINSVCSQSLLRDYLLDCKSGLKKSDQAQRLASIIKVWNSLRSGRSMTSHKSVVFYKGRDQFKKAK